MWPLIDGGVHNVSQQMWIHNRGGCTTCVCAQSEASEHHCYSRRNTASANSFRSSEMVPVTGGSCSVISSQESTRTLSTEKRHGGTTCCSNTFTKPAISLLEECRGAALWAESGKHAQPLKWQDMKSKLQLRFLRKCSSALVLSSPYCRNTCP